MAARVYGRLARLTALRTSGTIPDNFYQVFEAQHGRARTYQAASHRKPRRSLYEGNSAVSAVRVLRQRSADPEGLRSRAGLYGQRARRTGNPPRDQGIRSEEHT